MTMVLTRHFLCIAGVILTLASSTLSQDDSGGAAASFNNENNDGNQQVNVHTTPTTTKQTTLPNLPPETTPVEVNRTTLPTVPTDKVVVYETKGVVAASIAPTGNFAQQTNPPTKLPGTDQGGDKDKDWDEDDDNDITKDSKGGGASHIQLGGVLLILSVTVGNLLRQWTSV
jgi:hypothetical protein